MKPIIRVLLSFCVIVSLTIAFSFESKAAETNEYPTQKDFQQIVLTAIYEIAAEHGEFVFKDVDTHLAWESLVLRETILKAEEWGYQNNVTLYAIHAANILLTLEDLSWGGPFWEELPMCYDPYYREIVIDMFPDEDQDSLFKTASEVNSCRLETI